MEKMKRIWKFLLVAIIILPCVMFFNGCSCSDKSGNNTSSNVTHTIHFYTGNPEKFNIDNQEVKDGGIITEPDTIGWYYYDDTTGITYSFGNWYSDQSLDIKYVWKFKTDRVYNDMTLYAKWNEVVVSE